MKIPDSWDSFPIEININQLAKKSLLETSEIFHLILLFIVLRVVKENSSQKEKGERKEKLININITRQRRNLEVFLSTFLLHPSWLGSPRIFPSKNHLLHPFPPASAQMAPSACQIWFPQQSPGWLPAHFVLIPKPLCTNSLSARGGFSSSGPSQPTLS